MKLFGRSGGYYLFWTGMIYFWTGMYTIFVNKFVDTPVLQLFWLGAMVLPFAIPPFGRWLNMDVTWDYNMFGWRRKQIAEKVAKDINDCEKENAQAVAEQTTPENVDANYTIGVNEHGRTQLRIKLDYGSATLTMTEEGVLYLIEDLAHTIRHSHTVEITPHAVISQVDDRLTH